MEPSEIIAGAPHPLSPTVDTRPRLALGNAAGCAGSLRGRAPLAALCAFGALLTGCSDSGSVEAEAVTAACGGGNPAALSTPVSVTRVFPGLTFTQPVALLQAPRDATRWFVVEQAGRVRVFQDVAAVAAATSFIDITDRVRSGGELGLLAMAFHPRFPADPRVYLHYTAGNDPLQSRVAEFRTLDGGATLDRASEQILLSVVQPFANHNGGQIAFGPDGYLYIALGDGGGSGDPSAPIGNGQASGTLLGKMLRIDVEGSTGVARYRIPPDNPNAGSALCGPAAGSTPVAGSCAETYASGFRNPWRWSFDRGSGELWAADVGQNAWEEVNRVTRGGNYGWRCREGAHPFNGNCGAAQNLLDPVAEYGRSVGQSVTGGYVYRGSAVPALAACYVFGDFISGRIWSISRDTLPTRQVTAGLDTGLTIASFAEGGDGELYVVAYSGGLYRLGRAP
jgi:glucose/arabinose dehydrogenase